MPRRRKRTSILSALLLETFSILAIIAVAQPTVTLGLLGKVLSPQVVQDSASTAYILPAPMETMLPSLASQSRMAPPRLPTYEGQANSRSFVSPPMVSLQGYPGVSKYRY